MRIKSRKGNVQAFSTTAIAKVVFIAILAWFGIVQYSTFKDFTDFTTDISNAAVTAFAESTALAERESLGFFQDVSDSTWGRYKERFRLTQPNYDDSNKNQFERWARHSNWFWAANFEPEFTCPHEFRLGKLGDGGKWICDPHRIPKDNCLIYSIGSNGNFQFETDSFQIISDKCEIHTFDLKASGRGVVFADEAKKVGVNFHHWGIGDKSSGLNNMKTFKEIMTDLNHKQRTVDVMKIDCERCEYDQFRQWLSDWKELGMTVRQIMLEIHNSDLPHVVDLFNEFQKAGYVMFHKEANYQNEGNCIEAAFLLLSPDFQKP